MGWALKQPAVWITRLLTVILCYAAGVAAGNDDLTQVDVQVDPTSSVSTGTSTERPSQPLPRNLHNLFCIVLSGFVVAWAVKISLQLLKVGDLKVRLARAQSLQLEGMSVYADDFQLLIRQHFNQILRIRRTVPPKPMSRYSMSIHIHPDSMAVCSGDAPPQGENPARSSGAFGVKFTADAMAPCSVRLFWGVSAAACNEFVQKHQADDTAAGRRNGGIRGGRGRGVGPLSAAPSWASRSGSATQESQRSLLEMEEMDGHAAGSNLSSGETALGLFPAGQYVVQSRDFFLPAGAGQRYATPAGDLVAQSQLPFDLRAMWLRDGSQMPEDGSLIMPLVIVALAQNRSSHELGSVQGRSVSEAHGQISFVRFNGVSESTGLPQGPEVVRQLSFGAGAAFEVQGVFGFEEDGGEGDCMICYSRPKNVLLLPCRHCSVCHPCLRSLRDEKCPLCRSVFSSYATFPISRERTISSGSNSPMAGVAGNMMPAVAPVVAPLPSQAAATTSVAPAPVAAPSAPAPAPTTVTAEDESGQQASAPSHLRPPIDPLAQRAAAAAAAELRAAACRDAGTDSSDPASAAPPADTRQARDVQLCRPRGVAPAARNTSQGQRHSGRARFADPAADPGLAGAAGGGGGQLGRQGSTRLPGSEQPEPESSEASELVQREPQASSASAVESEEETSLIVGGGDSLAGEGP